MFFILITPFGLIRRLFGNDELKILKKNYKSTWVNRANENIDKDSFKNQF